MRLLGGRRPANFYDPGDFWSGEHLVLAPGATLGAEVRIQVPPGAVPEDRYEIVSRPSTCGSTTGLRTR